MATPHNSAKKGDFAKTVLMPGDPLRSKFIAENFLEDAVLVNNVRGVQGYTGKYKGRSVSVMASGMGMPSMSIYSYELFSVYDVDTIIRVGSAGATSPSLKLKDIVIADSAYTVSNIVDQLGFDKSVKIVATPCKVALAEKIAKKKGLKIVICVDEFQNIAEFTDPDYFQKKLRSHWQLHQNVAYCLYGSKRHMMMEVFTDSSKPFYKFGNLMFLNKIETPCLVDFFKNRFADTGKNISDEASHLIAKLVDNHPYYAQQLAQLSWLRTKDVCTVEIVREAHTALVEQLSLLFITITETLTTQQLNYLKALIAGEKAISSTEVMHRYQISSTTSISRSKAALIKNDVLDNKAGEISFQDPIYAYWLKTEYFAK